MRKKNHAESTFTGYPWDHSGAGRSTAPRRLRLGVMMDGGKGIQDKILSVLVAAVAALLCAAIDHLTKEENQ